LIEKRKAKIKKKEAELNKPVCFCYRCSESTQKNSDLALKMNHSLTVTFGIEKIQHELKMNIL